MAPPSKRSVGILPMFSPDFCTSPIRVQRRIWNQENRKLTNFSLAGPASAAGALTGGIAHLNTSIHTLFTCYPHLLHPHSIASSALPPVGAPAALSFPGGAPYAPREHGKEI